MIYRVNTTGLWSDISKRSKKGIWNFKTTGEHVRPSMTNWELLAVFTRLIIKKALRNDMSERGEKGE